MPWWERIAQLILCRFLYEAFYLILLVFVLGSFFSTIQVNANGCKDMVFKVTMDGKALANHVFKTVPTATNDGNCESKCFQDDRCISYNFGTNANGEKYTCELSDSDHIMNPEDLVDRPGCIYRSAENTCDCPDYKSSTCRFNFVDRSHRCECKPGFIGDNCEGFNPCANAPCLNGGTCNITDRSRQIPTDPDRSLYQNGYACNCLNGYTGRNCEFGVYSVSNMLSWTDVERECGKKRLTLPSIHSDEDNERIRNLTQAPLVWIGLKRYEYWAGWVDNLWSDGSRYDYSNWSGSTTDRGICVYMEKKTGKWRRSACSKGRTTFYICTVFKPRSADLDD